MDVSAGRIRTVWGAAAALLIIAVTLVALIAGGVFDPKPLGPLVAATEPGAHSLDGRGERLFPQDNPLPPAPLERYSVRLTAAHAGGEIDSGYGLALGGETGVLVIAVSPPGYTAIWETRVGDEPIYQLPWQPWPHVRGGDAANEIWLDVERVGDGARVTARINRELLWHGDVDALEAGVSLWLGSFGGPVTVDFRSLEWFHPS